MIKPSELTIIGAIEGSFEQFVEKEYIYMIRSFRNNAKSYSMCPIILLQPTEDDISIRTMIELKKLGVRFIKSDRPIKKKGRGFLNMPYTCNYLKDYVETKYMLWLDCDVAILGEPRLTELNCNDVVVHSNMLNYKTFFNNEHKEAYLEDARAQKFIYELILDHDELEHINTWFILAHTNSDFWNEWYEETNKLIMLIEKNESCILEGEFTKFSGHKDYDEHPLSYALSCAEEIAAGVLAKKYNYQEPINTGHQHISKDTIFCHYDDWQILREISPDPLIENELREICKVCQL